MEYYRRSVLYTVLSKTHQLEEEIDTYVHLRTPYFEYRELIR